MNEGCMLFSIYVYEMYVFCKQMYGPPFLYDYWSAYGLLYLCLNLSFLIKQCFV